MRSRVPGLKAGAFLLVALSLSIGWGIRGNFGHEYGAMIAGTLSAIAACVISGRADWRARLPYIGMFGALGWAFGASISYMQVISYTHSGHLPSQIYGFVALFLIGFLWAALGGAGTAFGAIAKDTRLKEIFRPIGWVFTFWLLLTLLLEPLLEQYVSGFTDNLGRHESPLYWFDADWLPALTALVALFFFDLWDRRFAKAQWLPCFATVGALAGYLLQRTGLTAPVGRALLRYEGDVSVVPKEQLVINWPQFFLDLPQHLGWMIGLFIGVCAYFAIFGRFRSGASMLVHMAAGWFFAFLILPVLLGVRMTPPRSDDWAGILGVFLGLTVYLARNGLTPVIFASITAGIVGGLGFSGIQMLKLVMLAPGNPKLGADPASVQYWAHWQSANWHSWLEQSYGFVNGIGIALAMGMLATRAKPVVDPDADDGKPYLTEPAMEAIKLLPAAIATGLLGFLVSPWAAIIFALAILIPYCVPRQVMAISFVLLLVPFLNLVKNVNEWTSKTVPEIMKAPLFESIELSTRTWFVITWVLIALAAISLMTMHVRRRKLALVPASWLGKGQLLYLVFLWVMVIGNFERALTGFTEQRLLTEWVIFINAIIVTVLIVLLPREDITIGITDRRVNFKKTIAKSVAVGIAAFLLAISVETAVTRAIYGEKFGGFGTNHIRFGPNATWRVSPIQKGQGHL